MSQWKPAQFQLIVDIMKQRIELWSFNYQLLGPCTVKLLDTTYTRKTKSQWRPAQFQLTANIMGQRIELLSFNYPLLVQTRVNPGLKCANY
jgi:hypothetical protein